MPKAGVAYGFAYMRSAERSERQRRQAEQMVGGSLDCRAFAAHNETVTTNAPTSSTGTTVAGFAMSVMALLLSFIGGGVIPGVIAIVLLVIGGKRGRTRLGVAGSILTIIAIALSCVVIATRVANGG